MALLRQCLREVRAFQGDDTFTWIEDMYVVGLSGRHVRRLEPSSDAHSPAQSGPPSPDLRSAGQEKVWA
jgi:hypothetical protein